MDPSADLASVEVDRATADEVVFEVDDAETADLVLDGTGDAVSGLRVHTTTDRAAATKTVRYSSGGGGGGGGGDAPRIDSVSPSTGSTAGGTTVTITGEFFTGATSVKFGTTNAASFNVDDDGQITAVTAAHSATGVAVKVVTPSGQYSLAAFEYVTPTEDGVLTLTGALGIEVDNTDPTHPIARTNEGIAGKLALAAIEIAAAGLPASGLRCWLDSQFIEADNTFYPGTIYADRWLDRSGNEAHIYAAGVGSFRPRWIGDTLNGRDVLSWDGSTMHMLGDAGHFNFLHRGPSTVFALVRPNQVASPTNDVQAIISSRREGSADVGYSCYAFLNRSDPFLANATDKAGLTIVAGSFDSPLDIVSDDSPTNLAWTRYTFISDPHNLVYADRGAIRMNGVDAGGTNSMAGDPPAGNSHEPPWIAYAPIDPSGAYYFANDMAEILCYDRVLSIDEVEAVEAYLATKWGI